MVRPDDDPDIALDFDDAIQVAAICGGRVGNVPRPYELTYYASSGDRWELALSALEIADIADGHMGALVLHCCSDESCDAKFATPDGTCSRCDYFEDSRFGSFVGSEAAARLRDAGVPESAALTREGITLSLGEPDATGGGTPLSEKRYVPPWIKYRLEDRQLHIAFDEEGIVQKVTVMEKDWRPGV